MVKVQFTKPKRLRTNRIWPDEARHFTPWMAENLHLLGEALGCDLRLIATEHPVGRYFLDLFAEMDGFHRVAIENQYGTTDQNHFGQLITKGAGVDASVLIWISEWFTREHLIAVNRLNTEMGAGLQIFAVEVQPYQIGNSANALNFEVVAHPHGWNPPSESTPDLRMRRGWGFFERLCIESGDDQMSTGDNSNRAFLAGSPYDDWDSGVSYTLCFIGSDNNNGTSVHLWIQTTSRDKNLAIYDHLHKEETAIEIEVGHELRWERTAPGGNACAIRWRDATASIDDSPLELAQTRIDMLDRYRKLREALDKRLPAAIAAATKGK